MLTKKTIITWNPPLLAVDTFRTTNLTAITNYLTTAVSQNNTDGVQYGAASTTDPTVYIGVRHWLDDTEANNWIAFLNGLGASSLITSAIVTNI